MSRLRPVLNLPGDFFASTTAEVQASWRDAFQFFWHWTRRNAGLFSSAPAGLAPFPGLHPRLAPWAAYFRRFAAV